MKFYLKLLILSITIIFLLSSCHSRPNDELIIDDFEQSPVILTMSEGLTGTYRLDFATFGIIDNPDHESIFTLTAFNEEVEEGEIEIFLQFYRAGGMVSATIYEALNWTGNIDELDPDKIAVSIQVINGDEWSYTGTSIDGTINFTSAFNLLVDGNFNVLTRGAHSEQDEDDDEINVRIEGSFGVTPDGVLQ